MGSEQESEDAERKPRVTFDDVVARARQAKASAEPHIRALAEKMRHAADAAQVKAMEYRPQAEKLVRDGAGRVRSVVETVKPEVEQLVEHARPRVQKATHDAVEYLREHEDELRQAAREATRLMAPQMLGPGDDRKTSPPEKGKDRPDKAK